MKIKIISDGTVVGTKIVNAETGELIENVISVDWKISVRDDHQGWRDGYGALPTCIVEFVGVAIDATGEIPETLEGHKARLVAGRERAAQV
jgi:hypothetical protein